jgi:hypothetical protein
MFGCILGLLIALLILIISKQGGWQPALQEGLLWHRHNPDGEVFIGGIPERKKW